MQKSDQIVSGKDIRFAVKIARKNWWIVLILAVLGYFAGTVIAYKMTSIYQAEGQILLKTNEEYNQGSLINDVQNYYGRAAKTYIDNSNEKRIITSYDMVKKAIDKLSFEVSYFLVGRLKTEEVFTGVPFRVLPQVIKQDLYETFFKFKVLSEKEFELRYTRAGQETVLKGEFGKLLANDDISIKIDRKPNLITPEGGQPVAEYLFSIHEPGRLISKYQSTLKVDNPEYTNILRISIEDEIPQRAVMFLDTLISVYIDNSVQQRLEINTNTLFFIDKQLDEVTNILNTIEDTLQRYREYHTVLDLNRQGEEYLKQYMGFDDQKRGLQLQIEALQDLQNYIIEEKDPQFLPPSAYIAFGDPFLKESVERLYAMQMDYTEKQTSATEDNFGMQQIKQRISNHKSNMLVYIANNIIAVTERIAEINKQQDTSLMNIQEIPLKQRGLINISRKLKVNEDMYLFLLQKKANTIIARAGIVPEVKIIGKGRSLGIVKPDKDKVLYFSIAVCLLIGAVVIFFRVVSFDRIESYAELKDNTTLPIVGEIVYSPTPTDLKIAVESDPKSPVAESFRTIRTNLQYMLGETQRGVIVITSNSPGEGKTFCSINLAAILAKGGKKVILLELDLHKPRVQKGLGMESAIGFSTVAIGKNTVDEVILQTSVENLDVILSGPLPPNPSEIVVSSKLNEMLEYCKAHYDFVVVDTPPVGLITDALVLMKTANVNLFVMNTKQAYRASLNNAHEIVRLNQVSHFGFILNGVKRKKSKYYYNRYAYGYGYGAYGGGYGSYGSYGGYGSSSKGKRKKS